MYINPFFAGIVSTVIVELIAIIGIALYMGNKK